MKRYVVLLGLLITLSATATFAQDRSKKMPRPILAMNDLAVNDLVTAVRNQPGDDSKMMVIKAGIKNNTDGITVEQELRLLNHFSNDNAKLECARRRESYTRFYKEAAS
jgi:hypothetical protein